MNYEHLNNLRKRAQGAQKSNQCHLKKVPQCQCQINEQRKRRQNSQNRKMTSSLNFKAKTTFILNQLHLINYEKMTRNFSQTIHPLFMLHLKSLQVQPCTKTKMKGKQILLHLKLLEMATILILFLQSRLSLIKPSYTHQVLQLSYLIRTKFCK